jgi:hypothetical protein
VRPIDGWTGPQPDKAAGPDPDDPRETPPSRPDRPLLPYRDFSVEYPPGFFLLVLPPALLGLDLDGYRLVFSWWMALLLTAALLAAIRIGRVLRPLAAPSPVAVATLLGLALGTVAVRRFDAIVSLSLCLFLDGCLRRKPLLSGLALGVGLVTKMVPVLVVPLALIHWAALRRWRELAVAALVTSLVGLVVGVPFLLAAGEHLLDLLAYRPAAAQWRARERRCSPSGASSIQRRRGGWTLMAATTWWVRRIASCCRSRTSRRSWPRRALPPGAWCRRGRRCGADGERVSGGCWCAPRARRWRRA